eukprot:2234957-Pleurochrysis_carterae.AAC.1
MAAISELLRRQQVWTAARLTSFKALVSAAEPLRPDGDGWLEDLLSALHEADLGPVHLERAREDSLQRRANLLEHERHLLNLGQPPQPREEQRARQVARPRVVVRDARQMQHPLAHRTGRVAPRREH